MQTEDYPLGSGGTVLIPFAPHSASDPRQEASVGAGVPTSSGFPWQPEVSSGDVPGTAWAQKLAEATPTNAELLAWAGRPERQPPPSWWDDEADPFSADPD